MAAKSEFDAYADDYDAALDKGLAISGEGRDYFAHGRVSFLAECLGARGMVPGRILDFGCGTGAAVPVLRALLKPTTILGIDTSQRSIERASVDHAGAGVSFAVSSGYVATGDFDLAYTNGVFHHIPLAERPAAMSLLRDVLRPGGVLSLWENNPFSPAARYVMSRIPFDRDAVMISAARVRELAAAAGFQVIRTDYLFVFPKLLDVLRPLERMIRRVAVGAQYQVLCERKR